MKRCGISYAHDWFGIWVCLINSYTCEATNVTITGFVTWACILAVDVTILYTVCMCILETIEFVLSWFCYSPRLNLLYRKTFSRKSTAVSCQRYPYLERWLNHLLDLEWLFSHFVKNMVFIHSLSLKFLQKESHWLWFRYVGNCQDHERAFFDSADWALGKVGPSVPLYAYINIPRVCT